MTYVPSDIFHAAADGTKMHTFTLQPAVDQGFEARLPPVKAMDVAKIRAWIERGGDVNGEPDPSLLESAAFKNEPVPIVYPGARLLTVAAECGRVDVMRLLLSEGAAVNHVTRVPAEGMGEFWRNEPHSLIYREGCSALIGAVFRNQEDAVRLLIKHGADLNFATDDNSHSIFSLSLKHPRLLKMILAAGFTNINWRTCNHTHSMEEHARDALDCFKFLEEGWGREPYEGREEAVRARDMIQESHDILRGTRLAGSYKQYVIQTTYPPFKEMLRLRSLVSRGRAEAGSETPEAAARLFDGTVPGAHVWLVMQYWKLGDWRRP